jgi:hypothetical protein
MFEEDTDAPFGDDPLLRLLPDEVPLAYRSLPPPERAWRGRYFLMAWSLGLPEHMAWCTALADDPEHTERARKLVAEADDARIANAVLARSVEEQGPS